MNTTLESTFPLQAAIDWCMPQRNQSELNAILTDYQRLKALAPDIDPDKAAAMKARALHAGATRANDLHAAIDAVIEAHRAGVEKWTGSRRSRAEWLKRLIGEGAPGWRTIDDHLKTLSL